MAQDCRFSYDTGSGGHGLGHNRLRHVEVALEQERRNRQHIADVVEAVARIVGGKFQFRIHLDAGEVADGVAVLDPVEPAQRHATWIGLRRIELEDLTLDPLRELGDLLGREVRLIDGRHDAGADVAQST